MLEDVTIDTFRHLAGAEFAVTSEGTQLALVLVEVRSLGHARPGAREPFSLLFHGPKTPLLPQGMHLLKTVGMEAEIFFVPTAQDEERSEYQAIFT